jgi:DNA replication licensing factor MCM2
MPAAFLNDEMDEYSADEMIQRQMRAERMKMMRDEDIDEDHDINTNLDYEDVKGKVSIWVQKPDVIRWIRKIFNTFLRTFRDEANNVVYEGRIHEMCLNNKQSLEVTFNHLSQRFPTLAIWLAEEPSLILPILNEVAFELVCEVYPDYYKIHTEVYIRVKDLPVEDKLRDLR